MINTLIFQVSNRTSKKCAYNHLPEVPSDIEPQLSKLMTFSLIRPVVAVLYFLSHVSTSQVALMVKNLPANAGDIRDMGSTPRSGRSPGGAHSNPPQNSCQKKPMDRGAWRTTIHRVTQSWTWLQRLSRQKNKNQLSIAKNKTEASKITILIFNDASKNSKESIIFPKKWHEAVHCMTWVLASVWPY